MKSTYRNQIRLCHHMMKSLKHLIFFIYCLKYPIWFAFLLSRWPVEFVFFFSLPVRQLDLNRLGEQVVLITNGKLQVHFWPSHLSQLWPKSQLITFFFCQISWGTRNKQNVKNQSEKNNWTACCIFMWSVSYRITQLFLLLLVAKLLSFDSLSLSVGKEPKSLLCQVVLVVGDINTLYSRIIIRLLLNMDFKDIPNCFCSKFDLMHVKRKQNKTINAHFPFQLHATIHTQKYTQIHRC